MTNQYDSDDLLPDLARLSRQQLVALRSRMMRELGRVQVAGGPVTADDYRDSIRCMWRDDEVRAAHLAEAGPGHEQCPTINFVPVCSGAR